MRIAIFIKNTIYHGHYGGLETQNENLVTGLKASGQEVIVFAPSSETVVPGYVFVPGTTPGRYDRAWWSQSLEAFKKLHIKKPFDVVISQSAAGAAIITQKKELNVKTVVVAHGTIWGEVKTVWKRSRSPKDFYHLARSAAFGLKTYFSLDRDYLNGCDQIIAVSEVVKSALEKEFGLAKSKITVIPNGVELSLYQLAMQDSPEVTVLYFGRLEKEKGLEVLIRAFSDVKKNVLGVKLKIVGNGPLKIELQKDVEILSRIGYKDIPELLSSVNVFVLPSLRVEGLPMTLVESAAAGLPLIASDIGGNQTVVKDGVNGFLVKSDDVPSLVLAMTKLASNLDLRQRMGLASRKLAEKEFSRDRMIKRYLELL